MNGRQHGGGALAALLISRLITQGSGGGDSTTCMIPSFFWGWGLTEHAYKQKISRSTKTARMSSWFRVLPLHRTLLCATSCRNYWLLKWMLRSFPLLCLVQYHIMLAFVRNYFLCLLGLKDRTHIKNVRTRVESREHISVTPLHLCISLVQCSPFTVAGTPIERVVSGFGRTCWQDEMSLHIPLLHKFFSAHTRAANMRAGYEFPTFCPSLGHKEANHEPRPRTITASSKRNHERQRGSALLSTETGGTRRNSRFTTIYVFLSYVHS